MNITLNKLDIGKKLMIILGSESLFCDRVYYRIFLNNCLRASDRDFRPTFFTEDLI